MHKLKKKNLPITKSGYQFSVLVALATVATFCNYNCPLFFFWNTPKFFLTLKDFRCLKIIRKKSLLIAGGVIGILIHPVLKASSYQFSLTSSLSSADIKSYWFSFRHALGVTHSFSNCFLSVDVWGPQGRQLLEFVFLKLILPPPFTRSPHLTLLASLPPNVHSCYQSFP